MPSEKDVRRDVVTLVVLALISTVRLSGQAPATSDKPRATTVALRLVDPSGRPVAGAQVGSHAQSPDKPVAGHRVTVLKSRSTDARGKVVFDLAPDQAQRIPGQTGLYALHERRGLAAFCEVLREDVGKEVTVRTKPACHVHGTLDSAGLREIDWSLSKTNVYLHWSRHRPLSCSSQQQRVEFWVPPGQYRLQICGSGQQRSGDMPHFVADTDRKTLTIKVEMGQTDLDLGTIDLPPDEFSSLIGRPAPELTRIKGWKNGGPVTLTQLRGRLVVLDFWGHWCGPCLRAMPKLMELHDTFAAEDLVIIAVHTDSVASIEEMDARLRKARETYWQGRDLPFLVALDGTDPNTGDGERSGPGATTIAYGVQSYPTTVLIDRQGEVVGEMNLFRAREILQEMFGLQPGN